MPHVTFIHGIANKPPIEVLLKIWGDALAGAGLDLGAESTTATMVYWADVIYPEPLKEGAAEEAAHNEAAAEEGATDAVDLDIANMDAEEQRWVGELAVKLAVPLAAEEGLESAPIHVQEQLERIPLPWPVKKRIMKKLLRDVHHYLFNVEFTPKPGGKTYKVQDEIRRRLVDVLKEGAGRSGPHVLVSHSMGTVIAYDCLKRVGDCPAVDGLMTVGGPLGLDEIQDKLKPEWTRDDGFPHEKLRGGWINVWDRLDPVCGFDPNFANDYRRGGERVVADVQVQNPGSWKHDISKYLAQQALVDGLRGLLRL
jgi:hypothetical protein